MPSTPPAQAMDQGGPDFSYSQEEEAARDSQSLPAHATSTHEEVQEEVAASTAQPEEESEVVEEAPRTRRRAPEEEFEEALSVIQSYEAPQRAPIYVKSKKPPPDDWFECLDTKYKDYPRTRDGNLPLDECRHCFMDPPDHFGGRCPGPYFRTRKQANKWYSWRWQAELAAGEKEKVALQPEAEPNT